MLNNDSPELTRLYNLLKLEQRSLAAYQQVLASCQNPHQPGIQNQIQLAESEIQRLTQAIQLKKS